MEKSYIEKMGFIADPFQYTNADKETQHLQDYFIAPDYFESIWGDPDNPVPNIVYAPRGAGKTAQRIMLELRNMEYPKILSIKYIYHDLSNFDSIDQVTINYHLEYLNRIMLLSFLKTFERKAYDECVTNFSFDERQFIFTLCKRYLYKAPASFSKNGLRSLKYLEDDVLDIWNYLKKPLTSLIAGLSKAKGIEVDLDGLPEPEEQKKNFKEDFININHFIKKIGYECVYIFVDKIDELELTSTDPKSSFCFIEPLLKSLDIVEYDNLAFKFFIWDKVKEYANGDVRHDRIFPFELSWNTSQLKAMLDKRVRAYSKGNINDSEQLFENPDTLNKVFLFAEHSPRDSIRILKNMVSEQERSDPDTLIINDQVANDAIVKFIKQRTKDLIKDEKVRNHLKSLRKVVFTENDLIEKNIAFNRRDASNISMAIKNLGLISTIGTKVIKSGNTDRQRFNLYRINDARVAKFMFPHLTIDDFIERRTKVCKGCSDRFVTDNSYPGDQCNSCDGH